MDRRGATSVRGAQGGNEPPPAPPSTRPQEAVLPADRRQRRRHRSSPLPGRRRSTPGDLPRQRQTKPDTAEVPHQRAGVSSYRVGRPEVPGIPGGPGIYAPDRQQSLAVVEHCEELQR
jgi:hypothetical protein